MEYRFLGRTGVKVSSLAFGTMSFGGDADESASAALFGRAREAGINVFDTADVYNSGRSEEILGRLVAAAGARDQVVIASKAYFPSGKGPNDRGTSRYHLVRAVEGSLRRLATDRIDLFYLHRFDDRTALDETLRAIEDLVRQGKILYPAVSNFAAWQVARALGMAERLGFAPVVCMQPMYNLLKRQAEVEILPLAAAEGLAVMPYSPLAGGILSGKYRGGTRPDGARLATNKMYQTRYADTAGWDAAERLAQLAAEQGCSPAALAVAWVASHPAVTAPLLGARSVAQLEDALGAVNVAMTPELRATIAALTPEPPPATDRSEERSEHNYGAR
jgi:aryl-alcohol dehydrogenase-like predicted oxidoreductase